MSPSMKIVPVSVRVFVALFHASVPIVLPAGVKPENARFVVFVQEPKSRHIVGAAQL